MDKSDEGYLLDPTVFDDPDRADERPLYERFAAIEPGPITGTITANGASVDEILARVTRQIESVAGDRVAKITRVELQPLLFGQSGAAPLWGAQIEFEVDEVAAARER